jgi:hypothetical protein
MRKITSSSSEGIGPGEVTSKWKCGSARHEGK